MRKDGLTLTGLGLSDVFVARLSPQGRFRWIQNGGSGGQDTGRALALKEGSEVYVAGTFHGTATFGNTTLTARGSASTGTYDDLFVMQVGAATGQVQWAVQGGGDGLDQGVGLALDQSNRLYLTGFYAGAADFGSLSLTANGSRDLLLAGLTDTGQFSWVQGATAGAEADQGWAVALDGGGNPYVLLTHEDQLQLEGRMVNDPGGSGLVLYKPEAQWAAK